MSGSRLRNFGMKTAIVLLAIICLTGLPYRIIGVLNRSRGNWTSVFYCYAGSRNFVTSYALFGLDKAFLWRPTPIGIMRQNGEWGLVLASAMTEEDFLDPANAQEFARLQQRLSRIAALIGTGVISVAGILPGVLKKTGGLDVNDTRDTVVAAVVCAVDQMRISHLAADVNDVIVLGGAGRIGSGVVVALQGRGWNCHIVDTAHSQTAFPSQLHGQPALFLDIARKGAIAEYIPMMWDGITVLNEVFPRPSRQLVTQMTARGVPVFHLAGVAGRITPPLPHGYETAIPCCAARPVAGNYDVRIIPVRPDLV